MILYLKPDLFPAFLIIFYCVTGQKKLKLIKRKHFSINRGIIVMNY